MKKAYFIASGLLLFLFTVTVANAQSTVSPINPKNTYENKVQIIDQMVTDGELDKAKAEEIKTQMKDCDGTGSKKLGQEYNLQFGKKLGNSQGKHNNRN